MKRDHRVIPVWPDGFDRQEQWVLQSASADQPLQFPESTAVQPLDARTALILIREGFELANKYGTDVARKNWQRALERNPSNLWLARGLNRLAPDLLDQKVPRRWQLHSYQAKKLAVLIPGELRCLSRSEPLLERLRQVADLFITTSAYYRQSAEKLKPKGLKVIEEDQDLRRTDENLPVNSMRQWHKLSVCFKEMRAVERKRGRLYKYVVKWRSDYFALEPHNLLNELKRMDKDPDGGLIGASDKVFAGPRNTMLRLEDFWTACLTLFMDLDHHRLPINLNTVLRSDQSVKWYGFGLPKRLVNHASSVEELRLIFEQGGADLADQLALKWPTDEKLISLFPGDPQFASEVAFAHFLNLMAIPMNESLSLRGFLYSDRSKCQ